MFNRFISFVSAVIATAFVTLWLQALPDPVRIGFSVLVFFVLATPFFQWQWRKGAWWAVPLGGVIAGVFSLVPSPGGHIQLVVPAAVALAWVIQYFLRRKSI